MFDDIREQIETKWQTDLSGITTEYENTPFDRKGISDWVRLTLLDGAAFTATIGSSTKKIKQPGVLVASCFVLRGAGTKTIKDRMDTIADVFRNLRLTSGGLEIDFQTPTPANGDPGDPNLYMENLNIPFIAQMSKTDAT